MFLHKNQEAIKKSDKIKYIQTGTLLFMTDFQSTKQGIYNIYNSLGIEICYVSEWQQFKFHSLAVKNWLMTASYLAWKHILKASLLLHVIYIKSILQTEKKSIKTPEAIVVDLID